MDLFTNLILVIISIIGIFITACIAPHLFTAAVMDAVTESVIASIQSISIREEE